MNRSNLEPLVGQTVRWRGKLARFGNNKATMRPTVLLENLRAVSLKHGGLRLSCRVDHVWIDAGSWCEGIPLGSTIYLDAIVIPYQRGDTRTGLEERDYKLHAPHNVCIAKGEKAL